MPDRDAVEERLRAVERALTDDDRAPADLSDAAAVEDRVDDLARRTTDLEERVAELDAAVQALRGYVGNIRAVNDDVERRADAALAKVESLARDDDPAPTGAEASPEGRSGSAAREPAPARAPGDVGRRDSSGRTARGDPRADREHDGRRPRDDGDGADGLLARLGEVL